MVKIYYQFQVREIVDAMEERNVPKGSYVIREGKLFFTYQSYSRSFNKDLSVYFDFNYFNISN